ncbi:CUTA protein, partial [Calcarius ornatus]|nr:CUTA protein [Calcarius ornatus]
QVLALLLLLSPPLRGLALQLHSALTGSYVPGTHSVVFVTGLNEHIARDIARAIMDRRLAACVNILPRSSALTPPSPHISLGFVLFFHSPQLVKTRTSKIGELSNYVRSIHPFETPEIISLPIEQGNPAYLRWIEESVPRH